MINEGAIVKWKSGKGTTSGKVMGTHTEIVGSIIDGNQVTRRGRPGDRALTIKQSDGQEIVKLESEVTPSTEAVQA